MTIEFDRDQVNITDYPDQLIYQSKYVNSENLPKLATYLQTHQGYSVSEYFEKVSGFNLIKGMTYNINAHVPRVDIEGKLFFTMKTLREWTYGMTNDKNATLLFETFVMIPEQDETLVEVWLKTKKVQIPFEA
jgi:hypothetical protein